jgi:hypothetical protein
MIITREVKIKINESNYHYYENFGYDVYLGEEIIIPIELLTHGSSLKIECLCDGCGVKKSVIFKNYLKYGNEWGKYKCRKCSEIKRKKTLIDKFGVEYPIQNSKIIDKMKNTLISKYGVDNISKKRK